jgi:nickel-dependent lactate racemase
MSTTVLSLPYGSSELTVSVPTLNLQAVLHAPTATNGADEQTVLHNAINHPLGTPRLSQMARPGQKVVIVTSDMTRPCPSAQLLPYILQELNRAGIHDKDITVVIALGLHRMMTPEELERTVGSEVCKRVRVVNHDIDDTVRLGVTSYGTPVEIFREVVEADLRICLGNIEFHYFAGYSGGAKAILPGCASKASITANHAMMTRAEAVAGNLADNPVRLDIEEAAAMVGVDFILNVVVNKAQRVVAAFAGDVITAHRQGCCHLAQDKLVPIARPADIVLVSGGGYPKDINLYQAHKALEAAAQALKPGGIIILAAECREGFGNETFETWLRFKSTGEMLSGIKARFQLGGHKAAAIAATLHKASIYLISSLPTEVVWRCKMVPFNGVAEALDVALRKQGNTAGILVMPHGGSILPQMQPLAGDKICASGITDVADGHSADQFSQTGRKVSARVGGTHT